MVFLVFSKIIGRGYQKRFDCQLHMSSTVFCAIIRYCQLLHKEGWKIGIHLRHFSQKYAERAGYIKFRTQKVLFKQVAECILQNLFSATKCAIA